MKYLNASDVLPDELLKELQKHAGGALLYVPIFFLKERIKHFLMACIKRNIFI